MDLSKRTADVSSDKPEADADAGSGADSGADSGAGLRKALESGGLGGSLTDAIKAVATGHARKPGAEAAPLPQRSLTQALKDVASRKRNPPTTRAGRKGIVIYVDQEVAASIRRLAEELNTTVQGLGTTAFDLLLEKFGEPRAG